MSQATSMAAAPRARDADTLASTVEVAPNLPAGLPKGLRNYWYPVLQSGELAAGRPFGFTVLGENLVAWRGRDGGPNVVRDRCPHRSIKLSVGRVFDGHLQCILHGLRFNGERRCTMVPWEENDERKKVTGPRSRLIPPASLAAMSGSISATAMNFRRRRSNRRCRRS